MIRQRLTVAVVAAALAAVAALTTCGPPRNVGAPGPDGYVRNFVPVALLLPDGPVRDGARLAIDEINESGGVLGLPVRLVEGPDTRAVAAFGCPAGGAANSGTAASGTAARGTASGAAPAAVLFCPDAGAATSADSDATAASTDSDPTATSTGSDPTATSASSDPAEPGVFYTGSAPNQRVVPALEYLVSQGRTSLQLALGDDPFSRATAAIVRAYAATGAVSVVGSVAGEGAPTKLAHAAARPRATAVLSTLDAAGTTRLLEAYARAGLRPDRVPVLSLSLTEADLADVPGLEGHLLAGSYFQSLPGRANEAFITAFRRGFVAGEPTSEPVESAYLAVYVWRAMVAKSGSFRPEEILARDGLIIDAPEGRVAVDAPRGHLYRTARVGRVGADGVVRTVWEAGAPVRPDPELLAYR